MNLEAIETLQALAASFETFAAVAVAPSPQDEGVWCVAAIKMDLVTLFERTVLYGEVRRSSGHLENDSLQLTALDPSVPLPIVREGLRNSNEFDELAVTPANELSCLALFLSDTLVISTPAGCDLIDQLLPRGSSGFVLVDLNEVLLSPVQRNRSLEELADGLYSVVKTDSDVIRDAATMWSLASSAFDDIDGDRLMVEAACHEPLQPAITGSRIPRRNHQGAG